MYILERDEEKLEMLRSEMQRKALERIRGRLRPKLAGIRMQVIAGGYPVNDEMNIFHLFMDVTRFIILRSVDFYHIRF